MQPLSRPLFAHSVAAVHAARRAVRAERSDRKDDQTCKRFGHYLLWVRRRTPSRSVRSAVRLPSEHDVCYAEIAIVLLAICSLPEVVDLNTLTEPSLHSLDQFEVSSAAPQSSACNAWLPDLMKVKVWRGSGSRCQNDITVATQLSIDRCPCL